MAIYLGDTKLTGTGVQVDNALSSTSTNPVENKAVTDALTDIGYSEWQKPSDWIDIRSGALPNSVYYLVGHSADYTTFPAFDVYAQISNIGTYDIYIDGVKKYSAVASGTLTTLTWQTLALETGYNTTYPQALRTHIVRVTPTLSTNTINRIGHNAVQTNFGGILWVHFTTRNYMQMRFLLNNATIAEAVTCDGEALLTSHLYCTFTGASSLKELPVIDGNNTQFSLYNTFKDCVSLTKISLKNLKSDNGTSSFRGSTSLKKIICNNVVIKPANYTFRDCVALENIPTIDFGDTSTVNDLIKDCTSLKETFLDFSSANSVTKLDLGVTSTARVDGLKGLVVSNLAPFTGASPQINVSYTGLDRSALVNLFNSMPTVTDSQVCNVTGCTGASSLDETDLAIATAKGWTVTR